MKCTIILHFQQITSLSAHTFSISYTKIPISANLIRKHFLKHMQGIVVCFVIITVVPCFCLALTREMVGAITQNVMSEKNKNIISQFECVKKLTTSGLEFKNSDLEL
jgi:hypothetical protein